VDAARLRPVTARNRIVLSAHLTNYAHDGNPTERHAAYDEARAGGSGLIVTDEHSTHPTDWPYVFGIWFVSLP
jgi:2,4-dienoyl-CoA reductase (NADPH2)